MHISNTFDLFKTKTEILSYIPAKYLYKKHPSRPKLQDSRQRSHTRSHCIKLCHPHPAIKIQNDAIGHPILRRIISQYPLSHPHAQQSRKHDRDAHKRSGIPTFDTGTPQFLSLSLTDIRFSASGIV